MWVAVMFMVSLGYKVANTPPKCLKPSLFLVPLVPHPHPNWVTTALISESGKVCTQAGPYSLISPVMHVSLSIQLHPHWSKDQTSFLLPAVWLSKEHGWTPASLSIPALKHSVSS